MIRVTQSWDDGVLDDIRLMEMHNIDLFQPPATPTRSQ